MSQDNLPNINEPLIEKDHPRRMTIRWWRWLYDLSHPQTKGLTIVITTAKLTPGGSPGTMYFTNGILTGQSAAD